MKKTGLYIPGMYIKNRKNEYGRRDWTRKYIVYILLAAAVLSSLAVYMIENRVVGQAAVPAAELIVPESPVETAPAEGTEIQDGSMPGTQPEDTPPLQETLAEAAEKDPEEPSEVLVMLDPGHGGEDDGCVREGISEKDINFQIAMMAKERLEARGYQVRMTRDDDTALSLEQRAQIANDAGADIFVSIHQNSSDYPEVEGVEAFYSAQNEGENSERLTRLVHKYILESTGAVRRELLTGEELYVVRECTMPACLVETGFLSNDAERGRLIDPGYQGQIADGIVSGIDLYFFPKTMYLTFDDGPSAENTGAVLDTLKEKNIKATFFLIGENVKKHPDVAKRIVEEGHTIGIHCNWHDYKQIYASVDSYLEDFEKAYQTVEEVTGVQAKLFRFPGGSINSFNKEVYEDIIREMTERGFIYFDWNASLEDAVKHPEADILIQNAVSSTRGRKRVVMLAHDVISETAGCLKELLKELPEYRMEPLTEEVKPIQF